MSSSTFTSRPGQRNQPAAIPTPTRSANTVRAEAPQNTGSVSGPVAAHPSADTKAQADKSGKPANKNGTQSPKQATPPDKQSTSGGQAAPQANKLAGQSTTQSAPSGKQTPGNQSAQSDKQSSSSEKPHTPRQGNERDVVFELDDQNAQDIRLVGCFTEWDKSPIALRKINSKLWQTKVRLGPGRYQYRFLVDGEWRDDPHAAVRHPNPYGTFDAVREIS